VLGFNSSFSVDRVGRSGGLAMFWHSSINCNVLDYSQNHISLEIVDTNRGNWRLTGFYGYPNSQWTAATRLLGFVTHFITPI
jgi:hypothetical protein